MSGPRETVYDEKIHPLMAQIIEIAKEAGIPMFMHFTLDPDDEDDETSRLVCTTCLPIPGGSEDDNRTIGKLYRVAKDGWDVTPRMMAFAITTTKEGT